MDSVPLDRPPKPPFDRERFVFKTLAVVIGTQLLVYSLAAGVCGQRALEGRPIGQICPGTLEQLQGGFDSTLNLLLGLLFQLSTLLLVLAGPVPPQPLASTNTVFRPNAGTDAGEVPPVTPLSER